MIPEQGVMALMHDGKEKVLGNGALYKKATKAKPWARWGLWNTAPGTTQKLRASGATRTWKYRGDSKRFRELPPPLPPPPPRATRGGAAAGNRS
jgi:hypothetical protein